MAHPGAFPATIGAAAVGANTHQWVRWTTTRTAGTLPAIPLGLHPSRLPTTGRRRSRPAAVHHFMPPGQRRPGGAGRLADGRRRPGGSVRRRRYTRLSVGGTRRSPSAAARSCPPARAAAGGRTRNQMSSWSPATPSRRPADRAAGLARLRIAILAGLPRPSFYPSSQPPPRPDEHRPHATDGGCQVRERSPQVDPKPPGSWTEGAEGRRQRRRRRGRDGRRCPGSPRPFTPRDRVASWLLSTTTSEVANTVQTLDFGRETAPAAVGAHDAFYRPEDRRKPAGFSPARVTQLTSIGRRSGTLRHLAERSRRVGAAGLSRRCRSSPRRLAGLRGFRPSASRLTTIQVEQNTRSV